MWRRIAPPIIALIVGLLAVEVAVRVLDVSQYLLPPPSVVVATLWDPRHGPELWQALGETAAGSLIGFVLGAMAGVFIAVALASAGWMQRAFYPYAVFFQTVPIIAVAPLLVIWFGIGLQTVVASAFIVSIFPMIASTLAGLLSTDPDLRDLFRLYGAGPVATLVKLRLPAALPHILTGLRVAAGLAVIGAVVGEYISGGGLGSLIEAAKSQQRAEKVFAALLLASLLGLALFAAVGLLSRLLLAHWHPSERAAATGLEARRARM